MDTIRKGWWPRSGCGRWVLAVILPTLWGSGCEETERPSEPTGESVSSRRPESTPELRERGRTVYLEQCASCHGEGGRGDGPAAYLIFPRPRDFSSGMFRLGSTDTGPTDEDLFRTISRGMPGSAMPPWAHLSEEERWALVEEVRRLAFEGKVEDLLAGAEESGQPMDRREAEEIATDILAVGEPVTIPPEPAMTLEGLARGKVIYLQICAPCHDADGRGRLKRDLVDSAGRPLYARDFTQGIFKGSPEGEAIATRLLAGMPGTPMPSYIPFFQERPGDLWALVHYVESFVPPGAQERVSQEKRSIRVVRVDSGDLTSDPASDLWERAEPVYLALMPLWWRDDRVEGVTVRALHDGETIALRLTWTDPTEDRLSLAHESFADAAAIQLSTEENPPFFAMGAAEGPVAIWQWKAQREADLEDYQDVEDLYPRTVMDHHPAAKEPVDGANAAQMPAAALQAEFLPAAAVGNPVAGPERESAVENLSARGFGTLTPRGPGLQTVDGSSRFDRGVQDVVFTRSLEVDGDDVQLAPGDEVSVAFAIWDGSAGDRNGQKSVTIWHSLTIDE